MNRETGSSLPRRISALILPLLLFAGVLLNTSPAYAQDVTWTAMGDSLAGATVLDIAVKPGTDDSLLAVTSDGVIWSWNSTTTEWDSVWVVEGGISDFSIIVDPLNPDSVFLCPMQPVGKPAGATLPGSAYGVYRASWTAAAPEFVAEALFTDIILMPDGVTLLAATSYDGFYTSINGGATWTWSSDLVPAPFIGLVEKMEIVPGNGGNLLIVVGNNLYADYPAKPSRDATMGGSWPALVTMLNGMDPWVGINDSTEYWEYSANDVLYDPVNDNVVIASGYNLWTISRQDLADKYDARVLDNGAIPVKTHPSTYIDPREMAVDGTDIVIASQSGGAYRATALGEGPMLLDSSGESFYYGNAIAAGATQLFIATSYNGVFASDLTGGTPLGTVSGRIEINGARPPEGSMVAALDGPYSPYSNARKIAFAETDTLGEYSMLLPAGEYTILFFGDDGVVPYVGTSGLASTPYSTGEPVTVTGDMITTVDFMFDGVPEWTMNGYEPISLAVPIAPGRTVEGTINSPYTDYDWFYVPVKKGQAVNIKVESGLPSYLSPAVELYTRDWYQIGSHGYYGQEGTELAATALSDSGLWFRIYDYNNGGYKPADGSFNHTYTLSVESIASEVEPNDDPITAMVLPALTDVAGTAGYVTGEMDVYTLRQEADGLLWIELSYLQLGYMEIALIDSSTGADYVPLGNVNTSSANTWRFDGNLPIGTYYLTIFDMTGSEYDDQYLLRWGRDIYEPNDDPTTAIPIAYGDRYEGMLFNNYYDVDFYAFSATAGDLIHVEVDPNDEDAGGVVLAVGDDIGEFIRFGVRRYADGTISDETVGLTATIPSTGTYYIIVQAEYGNLGEMAAGFNAQYDVSLDLISSSGVEPDSSATLFTWPMASFFSADVAIDAEGNAHLVWVDTNGGGELVAKPTKTTYGDGGWIYYAKIAPDGTVLAAPTEMATGFAADYFGGEKLAAELFTANMARPTIKIDTHGNVHLAWTATGYPYSEAFNVVHVMWDGADAPDDGLSLDQSGIIPLMSIPVVDAIGNQANMYDWFGTTGVRMEIDSQDIVHLVWDEEYAIRHARLKLDGNLIGSVQTVADFNLGENRGPGMVLDANNNVHIAWSLNEQAIKYAMLGSDGTTLIPPTTVSGDGAWVWGPSLELDLNGYLHVAWTESNGPDQITDRQEGEIGYTRIDPSRAPRDGSPVGFGSLFTLSPTVITPDPDWPSLHPNLIAGNDGMVRLSWHQWGIGSPTDMMMMNKPSSLDSYAGPTVVGIQVGTLTDEGQLYPDVVTVDGTMQWRGWADDPSPAVFDANGDLLVAWISEFDPEYYSNAIKAQLIPMATFTYGAVEMTAWQIDAQQPDRVTPGATFTLAVSSSSTDALSSASASIVFDPAVMTPSSTPLVSSLFTSAEVSVEGDTVHVVGASASPVAAESPLFEIAFDVLPDVPLLSQSAIQFVYDAERDRRTLLDEERPAMVGTVVTAGLYGDATLDGSVSALDASAMLKLVVGLADETTYPGLINELSDVSGRMGISGYDAALVLGYVVGGIDYFPVESGIAKAAATADAGVTFAVDLGTPRVSNGVFTVPVHANRLDGVISGYAEFSVPEAFGEVVGIGTGDGNGQTVWTRDGDVVRVAFADPNLASEDGGTVLNVMVEPSDWNALSEISLVSLTLNEGDGTVQLADAAVSLIDALPTQAEIGLNAPNPFNPVTSIPYAVPYTAETGMNAVPTTLSIYSITGQVVATIVNESMQPGRYTVTWNGLDTAGRPVGAGVYVAALRTSGQFSAKKMTLIR